MERRLAAILIADVYGYTRLMGEDEAGTLRRLTALREQVLQPLIAEHTGRIVKLMGDGLLVEFPSIVDAVGCAVAWQAVVVEHEKEQPEADRLIFRIGVNLGDVLVDGDDIYGDGVNIAARLESLAEPGGICLSGDAYRQVRGKVDVGFEDIGLKEVKNVAEPLRVFRVAIERPPSVAATKPQPLPDRPSIAVLPFDNMSQDPEQEYLADGISEDLITALSKVRWFFVIARNSTFTYKGQAVEVTQVAKELGVRYVIEGSVRKAGSRVRVTAQLIDATTGRHVWAERYDRDLADIFELQDEMTQTIVAAVEPELGAAECERAVHKPPESLDAWETYQRGLWHLFNASKDDSADLAKFLRSIDAAPAHLAGNSQGAFICLLLTVKYPELVRSLIIEEPPVLSLYVSTPPRISELVSLFVSHPRTAIGIVQFGAETVSGVVNASRNGNDEKAMRIFTKGVLCNQSFEDLSNARQSQIRENFKPLKEWFLSGEGFPAISKDDVQNLRVPVLLLAGENSPLFLRCLTDRLEELIPEAQRVDIGNASHLMHEDNPRATNEAMLKFMARH